MKQKSSFDKEIEEIRLRYARRKNLPSDLYNPDSAYIKKIQQEKRTSLIRWMAECGITNPQNLKLLEIGCGEGGNLLEFVTLGFNPLNLIGNELLEDRAEKAKVKLPSGIKIIQGNALDLDISPGSLDIVFQSMVFSSILNMDFKKKLASKMWSWVKPGGGVLWYDFIYNNPKNKDVGGIPFSEVRLLFNEGRIKKWKITLAPPISRIVTKIHPSLYFAFNYFPLLRTHILCWIEK